MKNKEKIIKSGAFLVATALVLVVVTVAWFISGSIAAKVEGIEANVDSDGFTFVLYEAEDTNKIGGPNLPAGLVWLPVSGTDLNISDAVPNQYRYFKAIIQTGSKAAMQVKFSGIEVVSEDPVIQQGFLSLINVRFRTEDAAAQSITPGGDPINENMFELLGVPSLPEVLIYDLNLANHHDETITIYYTIGVDESFAVEKDFRGASVNIGAIVFE